MQSRRKFTCALRSAFPMQAFGPLPSIDPNTDGGNEPEPMPFPHPPEGDAEVLPFFTTETRKP
ncbi:hypothetical protein AGR7A_Lc50082 [Agrobacterium deltaense NCPPB 1641]|uniref:Uncharacterized protein n=1 Tax=Agrobacterium deltaense NCPPB 1641 TaxID=1183425 RepID=A0A1S7U5L9_9HYPH|nr:hypothetical protein AGR7A_Lc50082 [Agrobacterium deltaense NCPPB 1641]